jgi:hypothetical protein
VWRQSEFLEAGLRPDRLGVLFWLVAEPNSPNVLRRRYIYGVPLERFLDYGKVEIEAALLKLRSLRLPIWLGFGDAMRCVHPSKEIRTLLVEGRITNDPLLQSELAEWRDALANRE